MTANLFLPLGLAFIMFAIGLTLEWSDFSRVFKAPRAIMIGLFCQLLLLPVVAFGLIHVWNMTPALATGVMILAACPGGITSNLLTHLARGDTALSISLTAISSLSGMVLVPVVVGLSMTYFFAAQIDNAAGIGRMAIGVFSVSTLPVLLGMVLNANLPLLAVRIERLARPLSIAIFAAIVVGAFVSQWSAMMAALPQIGMPIVMLNVIIMATGYFWAHQVGAGEKAARAISLEGGLQNGALGIFVATTLIGDAQLAVPSITYALIMNISGGVFLAAVRFSASLQRES